MAAGGNGGSRKRRELISLNCKHKAELNKLEMMGAIKFSKSSSDMLVTRAHILSYSKWPLTEDQIVQNT